MFIYSRLSFLYEAHSIKENEIASTSLRTAGKKMDHSEPK
jgi:hypothetical protein